MHSERMKPMSSDMLRREITRGRTAFTSFAGAL